MVRPAPNLKDPAELAAYRRELRAFQPLVRQVGVGLAVLGVVLSFASRMSGAVPSWLALAVIGAGVGVMLYGIVVRSRYHMRRMRGQG